MSTAQQPRLITIGWELLRLGAFAFGGLGTTLTLLQRGLVEKQKWLDTSVIAEALAVTRTLPGSTGIQVVAYLGWRLRGWPGAIVAAFAFIAPAAALMIAAAAGSLMLPDQPWVRGALTGLQVAVVGLLVAAMLRLARSEAKSIVLASILIAASVLGFFVHAAIVVVGAGIIGALVGVERANE